MKKLFLLLTLFLCTSMAWAYDAEVSGIYYYLNQSNKTAQVISNYGNKYTGDICIPESISVEGTIYVVTSLGNECFAFCTGLTSINIPNSVTSLGDGCFLWLNILHDRIINTTTCQFVKNTKIATLARTIGSKQHRYAIMTEMYCLIRDESVYIGHMF